MAQTNKNYNLIVREKGTAELKKVVSQLDKTNSALKKVQNSSQKTSNTLSSLRSSFNGFLAVLSVREVARFSDEIQLLEDRLSVFANEGEEGVDVLERLNEVAKKTRGDLTGLGEAYNRISINVKDLGLNTEQLLTVTQAMQQTFRLSGSSTAEANSSIIQFTQGLAQGELRGQELRSVLEANSIYGGLLAEKLGVARGELIKLGEAGKITSDVALSVLFENFENLNEQADKLRPTFEQGVLYGLNEMRLQVNSLNKTLNLSGGFFDSIKFMTDNITGFATAIGVITASKGIPLLVTQIKALSVAIKTGAISTGFGAIVVAAGAAAVAINNYSASLVRSLDEDKLRERKSEITKELQELFNSQVELRKKYAELSKEGDGLFSSNGYEVVKSRLSGVLNNIEIRKKELEQVEANLLEFGSGKKAEVKGLDKLVGPLGPTLADANAMLRSGAIDAEKYRLTLFQIGQIDINSKFNNDKINDIERVEQIKNLRKELGLTEEASFSLAKSMADGAQEYIKSVGTLSENISGFVNNTFSTLEDSIVEFVQKGKFEFKSLVDSIISDLLRIAIRQSITAPLAQGLAGAFGGGSGVNPTIASSSYGVQAANGAVLSGGNVVPFANGGVVGSPTNFGMSGGRTGLMGEAGPEGIIPLDRVNGKLGVNASGMGSNMTVNVINNGDNEIQTEEREGPNGDRILDVLIMQKVTEGIESGRFDKSMSRSYGVRRQGY